MVDKGQTAHLDRALSVAQRHALEHGLLEAGTLVAQRVAQGVRQLLEHHAFAVARYVDSKLRVAKSQFSRWVITACRCSGRFS
jgi:hypothetical protein